MKTDYERVNFVSLKSKIVNGVTALVSKVTGLSQDSAADRASMPKIITPGMPELLRKIATEGHNCVAFRKSANGMVLYRLWLGR